MQEIFEDISEERRQEMRALMTIVSRAHDLTKAIKMLTSYRDTLSPYEQDFMDFYFETWIEEQESAYGDHNSN